LHPSRSCAWRWEPVSEREALSTSRSAIGRTAQVPNPVGRKPSGRPVPPVCASGRVDPAEFANPPRISLVRLATNAKRSHSQDVHRRSCPARSSQPSNRANSEQRENRRTAPVAPVGEPHRLRLEIAHAAEAEEPGRRVRAGAEPIVRPDRIDPVRVVPRPATHCARA